MEKARGAGNVALDVNKKVNKNFNTSHQDTSRVLERDSKNFHMPSIMKEMNTSGDNLNPAKPKPKATRPKPVYLWTTYDVQKWFRRHCSDFYTVYSDKMIQNGICGRALLRMNDISLERLGIQNAEHREEIWRQITKLRLKADILEMKDMEIRCKLNQEYKA